MKHESLSRNEKGVLGIREMSQKYACSQRTLRFYEEKGLLTPAHIGNNRFYTMGDELKLQLIQSGKRLGLSLREIQALAPERSEESAIEQLKSDAVALLLPAAKIADRIALLKSRRDEIDAALAELRAAQEGFA